MTTAGAAAFRRGARARPLIFGHRGVRGPLPENTLAAFEAAASQGADGVELDVRLCRTGELVVLHDPTLARVTSGADERAVAEVPWDELRRADVGSGERPPLLADVLALCRARGLRANVEAKRDVPSRPAVVKALARLLRALDPRLEVIVSSFDPLMLAALRLEAPRIPRALLVSPDGHYPRVAALAGPLDAAAVHLCRTLTDPRAVAAHRRAGRIVGVWTVNDPAEARDLAALGVDSLITDRPGEIRAALDAT